MNFEKFEFWREKKNKNVLVIGVKSGVRCDSLFLENDVKMQPTDSQ